MNKFNQNPLVRWFGSLKLAVVLLLSFGIAIAAATFVEARLGTDGARALIYNARWFEILLAVLVINLILLLMRRMPYRGRQTGFVLVHIAIIVILVSAGITRFFGYEGIMPIREGQAADFLYSDQDHIQLSLGDEEVSFPVRLYRPGAQSARRTLHLGGRSYHVAVTEYWPHYTERLVAGEGGEPALQLVLVGEEGMERRGLPLGESLRVDESRIHFLAGGLPATDAVSPYGELRIRLEGKTHHLPVPAEPPADLVASDLRFTITEFHPDFKVGDDPDLSRPLNNPMIRVNITGPDGQQGERLLFAFHPDFSMSHGGQEEAFADLHLLYHLEQGLLIARGEAGEVVARATQSLAVMDMETAEVSREIPAGETFTVETMVLYRASDGDLAFVLEDYLATAVRRGVASDDPHDPAAVQVVVTEPDGTRAEALVFEDTAGTPIPLTDGTATVAYGPITIPLPYRVHLDDFVLQTYPGSDNPASYESHVLLFDPEQGINGEPARIYMNHPLTHRGFKHFQSSYDTDRRGTILSVNYDPGKWPTYFGYTLIAIGFILVLMRDLIWRRSATVVVLCVLAGLSAPAASLAQTHTDHPTVLQGGNLGGRLPSDEIREQAGRLIVQDFQGRMKPLDTLAREMVMKVTKRGHFEGWEPLDLYLNWVAFPETWWHYPLVAVRNPALKELLGVASDASHVAAADLYNEEGQYRFTATVDEVLRTPDKARTKVQRKLLSFDERFNLFYMTLRGGTLRLYPLPDDPQNTWLGAQEVREQLNAEQRGEYEHAIEAFLDGLKTQNHSRFLDGIAATRAIQQEYGAAVIPGPTALRAELLLNRTSPFAWVTIPYLFAFLILMIAYFRQLGRRGGEPYTLRHPLYLLGSLLFWIALLGHLAGYVLRWIASGRAPLSNGYESLVFISLAVGLAGVIFESKDRRGAAGGLAALLTAVILGVAMMATFDPAIGPLVPVLVSNWLIIHVTVITASYGFLGLAFLLGALVLILHFRKGPGRETIRNAVHKLDRLNQNVMVAGLALLSVGTLLGGVWANESWGRYWGWDAKETWSLVTIIVYAVVLHFRWIPSLNRPWVFAAGSFASVASVVMTYFGVNYFLSGLHSYAQGDAAKVPAWVSILALGMLALILSSWWFDRNRSWERKPEKTG